jgi:hypothetical protein
VLLHQFNSRITGCNIDTRFFITFAKTFIH